MTHGFKGKFDPNDVGPIDGDEISPSGRVLELHVCLGRKTMSPIYVTVYSMKLSGQRSDLEAEWFACFCTSLGVCCLLTSPDDVLMT